jgi:hypothetical protein
MLRFSAMRVRWIPYIDTWTKPRIMLIRDTDRGRTNTSPGGAKAAGLAGQVAPFIAAAALTDGAANLAEGGALTQGTSLGLTTARLGASAAPLSGAVATDQVADAVRSHNLSTAQAERMLVAKYGEQELASVIPFRTANKFVKSLGLNGLKALPAKGIVGAATQMAMVPPTHALGNLGLDETTQDYRESLIPGWQDLILGTTSGLLQHGRGLEVPLSEDGTRTEPLSPPPPNPNSDQAASQIAPLSAGRVVSGSGEGLVDSQPSSFDTSAPTQAGSYQYAKPSSVNSRPKITKRVARAFKYLANLTPDSNRGKTLETVRDANDLGAYLDEHEAQSAAEQLKTAIGRLGYTPPTPDQLGAAKKYAPNGHEDAAPTYNSYELLDRYRKALQMAVWEQQGTIELDRDTWQIKSIGTFKLTPEQYLQEIRGRYLRVFSKAANEAAEKLDAGMQLFRFNAPPHLQRGLWADILARRSLANYAHSIGVQEGPGQLLALNRRAYYQDGGGLHARPDVLLPLGVEKTYINDGKAISSDRLGAGMAKQLQGYHGLGATEVMATTPHGHVRIPRKAIGLTP